MAKITDVKDIDSMIAFLKEKGGNHENYYHYTTWDSLTKIMLNKTFLLTRGNSLRINDQHEALMKGSREEWDKIYIGSFAFGASENMAMWGLYGLPWSDAVRITIPKASMIQWINSIKKIKLFEKGNTVDYRDNFDISLNDIVYVGGKKGTNNLYLTHSGRSITVSETYPLYGIDTIPKMTGYIKNYAWQYENEVRLRIRLGHKTGSEKICVDIPDEVIDSIIVTMGPCFERNDNERKHKELLHRLFDERRINESGFENLVKYRALCELCQHKSFLKKPDN